MQLEDDYTSVSATIVFCQSVESQNLGSLLAKRRAEEMVRQWMGAPHSQTDLPKSPQARLVLEESDMESTCQHGPFDESFCSHV